jgi:hypothetical protein
MSGKRPFGVGLIGLLLVLNGLVSLVVGIMLLFHKGEKVILENLDVAQGHITALAIAAIAIGAITLIIALALRSGSNFARFFLVFVWLADIGLLIWSMVQLHALHWSNALWPAVITGLAAFYLLFDKDSRQFFSRAEA